MQNDHTDNDSNGVRVRVVGQKTYLSTTPPTEQKASPTILEINPKNRGAYAFTVTQEMHSVEVFPKLLSKGTSDAYQVSCKLNGATLGIVQDVTEKTAKELLAGYFQKVVQAESPEKKNALSQRILGQPIEELIGSDKSNISSVPCGGERMPFLEFHPTPNTPPTAQDRISNSYKR